MKNTLILTLSKFFEKGIMFLFFALLAHHFGRESFGEFSYYFTIASIIFVLFDVGGEFYQIREFTKHESLKVFQNIFIIKTVIASLVIGIVLVLQEPLYLVLLVISFYLDSIISLFRSSLYKNSLYYQEAILTISEKIALIAIVFLNIMTVKDVIVMYLSFSLAKVVYLFFAVRRFYSLRYLFSSYKLYDRPFFKHYALNSWSYVLHALLVVIFVQIDIVMLKWMGVSFEEIGLYSAAVKIYFTVVIFADILFKQYYPKVSRLIHDNQSVALRDYILRIQSLNIYASALFAFVTMLFAHEIIAVAFGSEFAEAGNMLVLLSIIIVFRFSMYTYTALLSSSNLNHIKLITSLTCVGVNIGLNYLLIPLYGVYGALFATIVTEFILVAMFKISSFKIVFTNFLTFKEVVSLLLIFVSSYIFYKYQFKIIYKLSTAFIIVFFVFSMRKILKQKMLEI
ncbi:MAG: oligosaccharide flippase family protein [Sulfurovaceae bacterium]